MNESRLANFLKETSLSNSAQGLNPIGAFFAKGGAKLGMSLTSFNQASDQLLVSFPVDSVLPIVSEIIKKQAREVKDPAEFDEANATFCILTGSFVLNRWTHPSMVFVYVKPVSEASTSILIKGYSNDYGGTAAKAEIKKILKECSLRFR